MTAPSSDPCLFCRIIRGEIPAGRLGESADSVAIADIAPQAPHHVLLIPKRHAPHIGEFMKGPRAAEEMKDLLDLGQGIVAKKNLEEKGYRLVINTGEEGGQTVPHLHIHLLAGREMGWPPG